jgi:hypothetical protein
MRAAFNHGASPGDQGETERFSHPQANERALKQSIVF